MEAGARITDWAEREPERFISRRATDGVDGDGPGDRRRGERRTGERRRISEFDNPWLTMGLADRRVSRS